MLYMILVENGLPWGTSTIDKDAGTDALSVAKETGYSGIYQ